MSFQIAQTFTVDKSSVNNAQYVTLTTINLFFKSKPYRTNNRSGINSPGASVYITETTVDSNMGPDLSKIIQNSVARAQYDSIIATADSLTPTVFAFPVPVVVTTGKTYAIIVAFDGDEDFEVWKCKAGETIVGSNVTTGGSTSKGVGKFFEFTSFNAAISEQWKPLNDVDLKFTLFCASYSSNTAAQSITYSYIMPSNPVEYVMYDTYTASGSTFENAVIPGTQIYQETPVIYGTITVDANTTTVLANSNTINFSTMVSSTTRGGGAYAANSAPVQERKSYILLRNGSTQAANVNIREVVSIVSNTEIVLNRAPTFSNNTASFSVTAAGTIENVLPFNYSGRWWDSNTNVMTLYNNRQAALVKITDSNANSTVKFVNNMVQSVTISSGGTGYSNSDVVTIYPLTDANTTGNSAHLNYIPSYSNAVANVVTNGSGTITGLAISNAGIGIMSNVAVTITTSGGTGANLVPITGSSLKTESKYVTISNTVVTNLSQLESQPFIHIHDTQSYSTKAYQHIPYYYDLGYPWITKLANPATKIEVRTVTNSNTLNRSMSYYGSVVPVLASKSNIVSLGSPNITVANGQTISSTAKASSLLEVAAVSNNIYTAPIVVTTDIQSYRTVINNDTTNEHTGKGKALARHISKKVSFADNRNAEDALVYIDAYRPSGTNIKVYVRLHNKADDDAFDDKDWTELELKSDNGNQLSNISDKNDLIEFVYGLPYSPPSVNTITGSATCTLTSANVVGSGTTWSTDLAVNDVVKLYSNLFPTEYQVNVIRSITNNTFITLDDAITTTGLGSDVVKIDFVGRGGSTPLGRAHSAWSNKPNSYICRYYDSSMSKFDTYSSFAVKIVLLSDSGIITPEVDNIRAVGVSV